MEKKKVWGIRIVIALFLGILFVPYFKNYGLGLDTSIDINNVSVFAVDDNGNLYGTYKNVTQKSNDIQLANRFLIKMNANGDIIHRAKLSENNSKVIDMAVGEKGEVYVLFITYESDMIRVRSEEIIRFNESLTRTKGIVKYKYTNENLAKASWLDGIRIGMGNAVERISEWYKYGNRMYTLEGSAVKYHVGAIKNIETVSLSGGTTLYYQLVTEKENHPTIEIGKYESEMKKPEFYRAYTLPKGMYPNYIVGTEPGKTWYSTRDGRLYLINEDSDSEALYIEEAWHAITGLNTIPVTEQALNNVLSNGVLVSLETADEAFELYSINRQGERIKQMYFSEFERPLKKIEAISSDFRIYIQKKDVILGIKDQETLTISKVDLGNAYKVRRLLFYALLVIWLCFNVILYRLYFTKVLLKRMGIGFKVSVAMFLTFVLFVIALMNAIDYTENARVESTENTLYNVFDRNMREHLGNPEYVDTINRLITITRLMTVESVDQDLEAYKAALKSAGMENRTVENLKTQEALNQYLQNEYDVLKNSIAKPLGAADYSHLGITPDCFYIFITYVERVFKEDQTIDRDKTVIRSILDFDDLENLYTFRATSESYAKVLTDSWYDEVDYNNSLIHSMRYVETDPNTNKGFMFILGMDYQGYIEASVNKDYKNLNFVIITLIFFVLLIMIVVIKVLIRPIESLTLTVKALSEDIYCDPILVKSNDEISDLALAFNKMSEAIRFQFEEQKIKNIAYSKFVPIEYQQQLDREIVEMRLGDFAETDMNILSFTVHDLQKKVEDFGNQKKAFHYIKTYLEIVGKCVRHYNGVISKYDNGNAVALFKKDGRSDILKAAIEIVEQINAFNLNADEKEHLDIGIGIHHGDLLIGVIGDDTRMEISAISEHVNVAMSLSGKSKMLGANILVSNDVFQNVTQSKRPLNREIGYLNIEGKENPVYIYDVFKSDTSEVRSGKEKTLSQFSRGVELYHEMRFHEARDCFRKVLMHNQNDLVAQRYFLRCGEQIDKTIEKWSPTIM